MKHVIGQLSPLTNGCLPMGTNTPKFIEYQYSNLRESSSLLTSPRYKSPPNVADSEPFQNSLKSSNLPAAEALSGKQDIWALSFNPASTVTSGPGQVPLRAPQWGYWGITSVAAKLVSHRQAYKRKLGTGVPWGSSGWESGLQSRGHGLTRGLGSSHMPWTTEPARLRAWAPQREKPGERSNQDPVRPKSRKRERVNKGISENSCFPSADQLFLRAPALFSFLPIEKVLQNRQWKQKAGAP